MTAAISSCEEAVVLLGSTISAERLRAARYLSKHATSDDHDAIKIALASEDVVWVRAALERAKRQAEGHRTPRSSTPVPRDRQGTAQVMREAELRATEKVSRMLTHELHPLVGILKLAAQGEIGTYEGSATKNAIETFEGTLRAIEALAKAARVPRAREFDLSSAVQSFASHHSGQPRLGGQTACLVLGDPDLITMVLRNAVDNAYEAIADAGIVDGKVIISWGATDRDYWISVIDEGPGPPTDAQAAFAIGQSTKAGHLGFGLAVVETVANSMGGTATLRAGHKGSVFEFRWPREGTYAPDTAD